MITNRDVVTLFYAKWLIDTRTAYFRENIYKWLNLKNDQERQQLLKSVYAWGMGALPWPI